MKDVETRHAMVRFVPQLLTQIQRASHLSLISGLSESAETNGNFLKDILQQVMKHRPVIM
jgi:hypothetical protein